MATLQGVTGTVSSAGQIVSNGNFTCQTDGNGFYTVGYGTGLTNAVPVVSLVNPEPMSYALQTTTEGFTLQVLKLNSDGQWQETESGFDFVVAQIA